MSNTSFIQRLTEHIISHYDLKKQDLTVVFPNKRAAYYLRNAIRQNASSTIWLPQMISIEEAITQWSGTTLADNIDLLFELIDIDAQRHEESDLSVFGSQAAQMARDFDEIDQYGVDAEYVFKYVLEHHRLEIWRPDDHNIKDKEQKYLDFFQSLHEYYLSLRDRLNQQRKGYYGMITRSLAELTDEQLLARIGDTNVLFAGFNALTTTEERIVNTLIRNGKAEIIFDYDSYYIDDTNNEAGIFARRYQQRHPSWLANGISDALTTEPKTIHIVSASGNAMQAKALQAKLQETNDEKQAVILADENMLIPVLNCIPESYSDFKVSMGYPMSRTPINLLVKMYFALCKRSRITRKVSDKGTERLAQGWYIWSVIHLMDLEIVRIIFPTKELEDFAQWKRQALGQGKFIFENDDLEALSPMPGIQNFLKTFLPKHERPASTQMLDDLSRILAFVAQQILSNDEQNLFLLNQVSEVGKIVSRLQKIVGQNARYIKDLPTLESLYRLLSDTSSLKLTSSQDEGLQIMGLLETRNLDFRQLHLLSVNEGIMPPDKSRSSFIPQYIRRVSGLPGYAEGQAVVAYHFYRLLQNSQDIYLYYNNLGDTSGGEASRYILQIKNELACNANIRIEEESFSSTARLSLDVQALNAQKANALERLHYLIGERGLSPSALSTYLGCPLKYYLKYITRIEDNSVEEDVAANDIGNVIHDALELLFSDWLPQDGRQQIIDKALFDQTIQPRWQEKLEEAIARKFPNGFPDVGFNYLSRIGIEQKLKNYLKYTSEQLAHNTLIILKTESDLKAKLQTPLGNCLFVGRADRIDRCGDRIRVIDYKTGSVNALDLKVPLRHDESDMEYLRLIPEKALQLLLYKYLFLRNTPVVAPEQVDTAIHGLRYAHNIEYSLTQTTGKNDNSEAAFLSNASFVPDMEALLQAVVCEMLDPEIPFSQTDDDRRCSYCTFRLICKRSQ